MANAVRRGRRRAGRVLPARRALLHGPPGVGKTASAVAVAREAGAKLVALSAGDVFGPYAGDAEARLRGAFRDADAACAEGTPCVILLDEIARDVPRAGRGRGDLSGSRVVAQLLTLMDDGGVEARRATDGPTAATTPRGRWWRRRKPQRAGPGAPASRALRRRGGDFSALREAEARHPARARARAAAGARRGPGAGGANSQGVLRRRPRRALPRSRHGVHPGRRRRVRAVVRRTERRRRRSRRRRLARDRAALLDRRGPSRRLRHARRGARVLSDDVGRRRRPGRRQEAPEASRGVAPAPRGGVPAAGPGAAARQVLLHGPPGCAKTTLARARGDGVRRDRHRALGRGRLQQVRRRGRARAARRALRARARARRRRFCSWTRSTGWSAAAARPKTRPPEGARTKTPGTTSPRACCPRSSWRWTGWKWAAAAVTTATTNDATATACWWWRRPTGQTRWTPR